MGIFKISPRMQNILPCAHQSKNHLAFCFSYVRMCCPKFFKIQNYFNYFQRRKQQMATGTGAAGSSRNTDVLLKSRKLLDRVSETLILKLNYISELPKKL